MHTSSLSLGSLCVFVLLSGCTALQMKPPPKAAQGAEWRVEGHNPRTNGRDRNLRIDAYSVAGVEGTSIAPAGLAAYGRVADQRSWDYHFELSGNGHTLHGECTEAVDHARWHGFGDMLLNLTCTCSEGSAARATLAVADDKGTLDFGAGNTLPVKAVHDALQGKDTSDILGYSVGKGDSIGAVDVTKQAHAFVPKALAREQQAALACAYAALLLHRPVK